jgi:hypothetical protein
MIVDLCSRKNRSLPRLPRAQREAQESLADSVLFDAASVGAPKTAIQFVKDGRASLLRIHPQPMTKEQAAAWLADFEL